MKTSSCRSFILCCFSLLLFFLRFSNSDDDSGSPDGGCEMREGRWGGCRVGNSGAIRGAGPTDLPHALSLAAAAVVSPLDSNVSSVFSRSTTRRGSRIQSGHSRAAFRAAPSATLLTVAGARERQKHLRHDPEEAPQ